MPGFFYSEGDDVFNTFSLHFHCNPHLYLSFHPITCELFLHTLVVENRFCAGPIPIVGAFFHKRKGNMVFYSSLGVGNSPMVSSNGTMRMYPLGPLLGRKPFISHFLPVRKYPDHLPIRVRHDGHRSSCQESGVCFGWSSLYRTNSGPSARQIGHFPLRRTNSHVSASGLPLYALICLLCILLKSVIVMGIRCRVSRVVIVERAIIEVESVHGRRKLPCLHHPDKCLVVFERPTFMVFCPCHEHYKVSIMAYLPSA